MNKDRRKEIANVIKLVEAAQAAVEEARDAIEQIKEGESEYYDNMVESFRDGEKGQRAEEVINYLDDSYNTLDEIDFDSITSNLESAAE